MLDFIHDGSIYYAKLFVIYVKLDKIIYGFYNYSEYIQYTRNDVFYII